MEDIFLYTVKMKWPILRIKINFHHMYIDVDRTFSGYAETELNARKLSLN